MGETRNPASWFIRILCAKGYAGSEAHPSGSWRLVRPTLSGPPTRMVMGFFAFRPKQVCNSSQSRCWLMGWQGRQPPILSPGGSAVRPFQVAGGMVQQNE